MSTDIPTPNPRPELTSAQEAFREALPDGAFDTLWDEFYAAYSEFQDKVPGWRAFFTDHHQWAFDNSLRVLAGMLDLPARDARIRAETLRWAGENVRNTVSFPWANGDPGDWQGAIARHLDQLAADFERSEPGKGFHSSPRPSAVPAEGSVHPQPATEPLGGSDV